MAATVSSAEDHPQIAQIPQMDRSSRVWCRSPSGSRARRRLRQRAERDYDNDNDHDNDNGAVLE
jgi:hypothetical protein